MFSADTANKLFFDLFINDNGLTLKPGAIYDFLKLVSKDGTIDCDAETLGSAIKGLIETSK